MGHAMSHDMRQRPAATGRYLTRSTVGAAAGMTTPRSVTGRQLPGLLERGGRRFLLGGAVHTAVTSSGV
jgi:hypothetical protein